MESALEANDLPTPAIAPSRWFGAPRGLSASAAVCFNVSALGRAISLYLLAFATATAALALSIAPALAHADGVPVSPHDLWTAWSLRPSVVVPITAVAVLYALGLSRAWKKAGWGRGTTIWQAGAFLVGLLALGGALVWPLDALGETLFSAHMGQHIALMGLSAPLLVLGLPLPTTIRALPMAWRRGLTSASHWQPWRSTWGVLTRMDTATVLQLLVFSLWHVPAAIALSLENEFVHFLMHGSILASALMFWTAVVRMRNTRILAAVLALALTFKVSLLIGAPLAFSTRAFYGSYAEPDPEWGLSLLQDQQLAGLIMMVLGSMMYLLAAIIFFAVWFRALESRPSPR